MNKERTGTSINIISAMIAFAVGLCINFFLSPYIVKHLGVEANGFVQLANTFTMYASLITIAIGSMAGRFITVNIYNGNIKKANKYYSSVIVSNIIIVAILLIPAAVLVGKIDSVINIGNSDIVDLRALFSLIFINFFVGQLSSILNLGTYVKNKLYWSSLNLMGQNVLKGILTLAIFLVFVPKMYYVSLIALIATMASIIPLIFFKIKLLPELKFSVKNFDIKLVFELLSSGIWNTINQCGQILMTGMDLFLANLFVSPVQMGILSVAKIAPTQLTAMSSTICNTFSPNVTIAFARDDKNDMIRVIRKSVKLNMILMSVCYGVFFILGYAFYQLWMPTQNAKELIILSVVSSFYSAAFCGVGMLYNVFTSYNKLKVNSVAFLLTGIVNIIIVFILLKFTNLGIYAIVGAGSSLAIIKQLLLLPYISKLLGVKWYVFYFDVLYNVLAIGIVCAITACISLIIPTSNWLMLALNAVFSVLISCVVLAMIFLDKEQKNTIFSKIFRRK